MSDKILSVLDAVTGRVFAFRPADKGLAAAKTKRRIERKAKREAQDDRESSI